MTQHETKLGMHELTQQSAGFIDVLRRQPSLPFFAPYSCGAFQSESRCPGVGSEFIYPSQAGEVSRVKWDPWIPHCALKALRHWRADPWGSGTRETKVTPFASYSTSAWGVVFDTAIFWHQYLKRTSTERCWMLGTGMLHQTASAAGACRARDAKPIIGAFPSLSLHCVHSSYWASFYWAPAECHTILSILHINLIQATALWSKCWTIYKLIL